jgi:hypothetical protein
MSRHHDCLDAVISVLAEFGLPYTVSRGTKHMRVHYEVAGRRMVATIAGSPSDHRAALNIRSQTRRCIREAGARA